MEIEEKSVEEARELSIQGRADEDGIKASVLFFLSGASEIIPPWWSPSRDNELRKFFKKPDHLSGAVYTMESRISTIPFRVQPRDLSIRSHHRQADLFQEMLEEEAEFGHGWNEFIEPFIEDYLTQDRGAFAEIIGDGDPDKEIQGPAAGIAHLDSGQCQLTGNPVYPVLYTDVDSGKRYKLHYTRVAHAVSMKSPDRRMNGVGFCAVSRCINVAQNLLDILVYEQEKLGSRPPRQIMITRGGLDPDAIQSAVSVANEQMNNQRLSRFSRTVVVGEGRLPDADLRVVDLASVPDGFDKEDSITLGMAAIALAFGVDARELFPAMGIGATRADALIQHLKQRGKGIGQIILLLTRLFNYKVLPPHLKIGFDYQDDAQDRQIAETEEIRSKRRASDLSNVLTDERTEREKMLELNEISEAQFNLLEYQDGRLEDGTPILSLFYSPDYAELLAMPFKDVLDVEMNSEEAIMDAVSERRGELLRMLGVSSNLRTRADVMKALFALDALEDLYEGEHTPPPPPPQEGLEGSPTGQEGSTATPPPPDGGETVPEGDIKSNGDLELLEAIKEGTRVLREYNREREADGRPRRVRP